MLTALAFALLLSAQQVEPAPAAAPTTTAAEAAPAMPPQPEGFGNLKWGVTQEAVKAEFPKVRCGKLRGPRDAAPRHRCQMLNYPIGDVTTTVNFIFTNDALDAVGVVFPSGKYAVMKDLLFEKYGPNVKVETVRTQESSTSRILDSVITGSRTDRPLEVYEVTNTVWTWPNVTVTLHDQRMHSLLREYSFFELNYLTEEEKAKRQKAKDAF